jgi:hypothetical protein
MRAHLGRVGSYSEHRSNLRERHSHDVMEIDGFALVGRQSRKRLDDDLPFLDGMGTRSISTARVRWAFKVSYFVSCVCRRVAVRRDI